MSKKRAFVKYTKKGKIIPGSLIVTTSGGHPVDGVYKEVPYDVCCSSVLNVGSSFQPEEGQIQLGRRFKIYCNTEINPIFQLVILETYWSNTTPQEAVDYLNSAFSWVGTWSWFVDPNDAGLIVINVAISQPLLDVLNLACPGGTIGYVSTGA